MFITYLLDLCPPLTLTPNVVKSTSDRTLNSVVILTCSAGYRFIDDTTTLKFVTCQNLQWVGDTLVTCVGKTAIEEFCEGIIVLHNYLIVLYNYVITLHNYVIVLHNYVIVLHNYIILFTNSLLAKSRAYFYNDIH